MSQHNDHARDHQDDDHGRSADGQARGPAGAPAGTGGGRSRRPQRLRTRLRAVCRSGDLGMATAEYAIATVAAVGFAGLLIVILRSDEVRELLLGIIRGALST